MARMHADGRGSSGSTRPVNPNTEWVLYDADEVEELVEKLHRQGLDPSSIGRQLRDRYGVPDVQEITGSPLQDLVDTGEYPEDLRRLMQKAVRVADHLDRHPNDGDAERRLSLVEAKIRRLADYYRGDQLPADWTYTIEKARLIVE